MRAGTLFLVMLAYPPLTERVSAGKVKSTMISTFPFTLASDPLTNALIDFEVWCSEVIELKLWPSSGPAMRQVVGREQYVNSLNLFWAKYETINSDITSCQ